MEKLYTVWWKHAKGHEPFYKKVTELEQAEYVLEILSNFSTFLGYTNSEGGVDEWDENALEWKRVPIEDL
jgi:hypothetical protein